MKYTCPQMSNTRWESISRVFCWFEIYRVRAQRLFLHEASNITLYCSNSKDTVFVVMQQHHLKTGHQSCVMDFIGAKNPFMEGDQVIDVFQDGYYLNRRSLQLVFGGEGLFDEQGITMQPFLESMPEDELAVVVEYVATQL